MIEKIIKFLYRIFCKDDIDEIEKIISDLKLENEDLKDRIESLADSVIIVEPPVLGTIDINDMNDLLTPICSNVNLSDPFLNLTSVEEAKKFTAETKVAFRQWVKEDHDCDNFSFASMGYWSEGLKSFAYGIAWSKSHAFNIFIDEKKQLWIVEPQTNKYIKMEDAKLNSDYWPLRLILM